jgi:NarL family two-component system sensor histidine kinase YdfH
MDREEGAGSMHEQLTINRGAATLSEAKQQIRWPLVFWILLTAAGTVVMQWIYVFEPIPMVFFGGLILLHTSLLWHFEALTKQRSWLYFAVQSLIIHGAAFLVPIGCPVLLIGLNPVLFAQTMVLSSSMRRMVTGGLMYYSLYGITLSYIYGNNHLELLFPMYILMTVVIGFLTNLFLRLVRVQHRTQTFLMELKAAHEKVEELTVANERQRMARDLHDTLAQGLAGLIMKLDAVNAHLSMKRYNRAQDIVGLSMEQAKRTLAEARQVIDDLRAVSNGNYDFGQAVREEIKRYEQTTFIRVHLDLNEKIRLSKLLTEHCFQIVKECLSNVAKHAEADHVWVWMDEMDSNVRLEVFDDGKGFDPGEIGKQAGHYGLIGIEERVRIIGGTLKISSGGDGTVVRIDIPLEKGETDEP